MNKLISKSSLILRPYQEECISTSLRELSQGYKRQIASLPVGSGKTVTFSNLIRQLQPPASHPNARKSLVIAHREELIMQAYKHILQASPDASVAVDIGRKHADVINSDIIVASVQSLGSNHENNTRLLKYDPSLFKCVIVDEAHHATADTYSRVFKHFDIMNDDSHLLLWGCSATVCRHDMLSLGSVFQKIVYHKDIREMIREGWLCDASIKQFHSYFVDLSCVAVDTAKRGDADYRLSELSKHVNVKQLNSAIVQEWLKLSDSLHLKSTLVFAVDVKHAECIAHEFQMAGVDARSITGQTSSSQRYRILQSFSQRQFPVLVNCAILTEGTDIPCIDSILMARPTKSRVLLLQMIGRGLRLYPGKQRTLILDFVNNFGQFGMDNISPTLDGLDSEYFRPNVMSGIIKDDEITVPPPPPPPPPLKFKPSEWKSLFQHLFDENSSIEEDNGNGMNPSRMSSFSWTKVDNDIYHLYLMDSTCLEISTVSNHMNYEIAELKLRRFSYASKKILPVGKGCSSLEMAFKIADNYALKSTPYKWLLKNAPWRNQPATPSQKKLALKLGVNKIMNERNVDPTCLDSLMKGQLQTLINRMIFVHSKRVR